jgi:hypothetical protein
MTHPTDGKPHVAVANFPNVSIVTGWQFWSLSTIERHCARATPPILETAMSLLGISWRRVAFRLPSPGFVCRQCLRQQQKTAPPRVLQIIRSRGYAEIKSPSPLGTVSKQGTAHNAVASDTLSGGQSKKAFPETSSKIAYWLLGSAASVFGIVVFGGLTRLTESG